MWAHEGPLLALVAWFVAYFLGLNLDFLTLRREGSSTKMLGRSDPLSAWMERKEMNPKETPGRHSQGRRVSCICALLIRISTLFIPWAIWSQFCLWFTSKSHYIAVMKMEKRVEMYIGNLFWRLKCFTKNYVALLQRSSISIQGKLCQKMLNKTLRVFMRWFCLYRFYIK